MVSYVTAAAADTESVNLLTASQCQPGVEQAVGQGGRMPLQISMQGGENRCLPSHFSMASLPMVRMNFGEN